MPTIANEKIAFEVKFVQIYCYSIINSYNASLYITEDQTNTHTESHQKKKNKDETSDIFY